MIKTNRELAELTAEWWTNNLKKPVFDNGDDSPAGIFTSILQQSLVTEITDKQLDMFKNRLADFVEKGLDANKFDIMLSVDYNPCLPLYEIAKLCGISEHNFPIKSHTNTKKERVVARLGYSGEFKILYATKEYWIKTIEGYKDTIKRYENGEFDWVSEKACKKCIEEMQVEITKAKKELDILITKQDMENAEKELKNK